MFLCFSFFSCNVFVLCSLLRFLFLFCVCWVSFVFLVLFFVSFKVFAFTRSVFPFFGCCSYVVSCVICVCCLFLVPFLSLWMLMFLYVVFRCLVRHAVISFGVALVAHMCLKSRWFWP